MKKYFGTDGIRGIANSELTCGIARRCSNSLTVLKKKPLVVVGRDTRLSGDMIGSAIMAGVTSGGGNVINLGIVSTPAVAYLTKLLGADYGIMISASHNPPEYNGIKIFSSTGYKIPDNEKNIIEERISKDLLNVCEPMEIGYVTNAEDEIDKYIKYLKSHGVDLKGMKVVLDCSNGSVFSIAPRVFSALGANVVAVNLECDGINVNVNCGALYPEKTAKLVLKNNADIGFSFDGDADRIMAIDSTGEIIDGDSIIYMLANEYKKHNKLNNDTVVGTLHTNMGIEKKLEQNGIKLVRTDVGDQYVLEEMLKNDYVIGGEQSGHIIMSNISTSGDGVLTAIILAKLVKQNKKTLSEINDVVKYPQENVGVIVKDKAYVLSHTSLQDGLAKAKQELKNSGRILLRASGTEPKIRVMIECENAKLAKKLIKELGDIVKSLADGE